MADDSNSSTTSLLDLPPELWAKIGSHVIEKERCITSYSFHQYWMPLYEIYWPKILKTYTALRGELLPLYYKTKVRILYKLCDPILLGQWLRAIGPEGRKCIEPIGVLDWEIGMEKQKRQIEEDLQLSLEIMTFSERLKWAGGHPYYHAVNFLQEDEE